MSSSLHDTWKKSSTCVFHMALESTQANWYASSAPSMASSKPLVCGTNYFTLNLQNLVSSIHADHCIYILQKGKYICFIAVYVDDIGLLSNDLTFMQKVKDQLRARFSIKDLGPVSQLLGIAIEYD
jgi:hypothetical protein